MAQRPPKEVTAAREKRAWELRQQLYTQTRIAEELGITQPSVNVMLKRVRTRLYQEFIEEAYEAKATQTAQLEHLANEAVDAWERSKLDAEAEETTEEQVQVGEAKTPATQTRVKRTRKGQAGDARFLAEARGALADIRDIWGIDAPKKTDVTSLGKRIPIQIVEVVQSENGNGKSNGEVHSAR